MSNALFDDIVARTLLELPEVRICTVSGFGELGTDREWRHKLARAARAFERVHVVTNLSLCDDDDLAYLASQATEVRVSIGGATNRTYRQVHRPPEDVELGLVERRIEKLASLRAGRLVVRLTCCELPINRAESKQWIERWSGVVDELEIWKPHNWVDAKRYRIVEGVRLPTCGRPSSGPIQVQVDGTVNVCCFDANGVLTVGDLRRRSFAEILGGAEMGRIRRLHATGQADELAPCAKCDQREVPDRKREHLVYCSWDDRSSRVGRTSSGGEFLLADTPRREVSSQRDLAHDGIRLAAEMLGAESVWDLNDEQVDAFYRLRHMNNYVHAGLTVVRRSPWPRGRAQRWAGAPIDEAFEHALNELLTCVPLLGPGQDTRAARIEVTRRAFSLYRALPDVSVGRLPTLIRAMAAVAYVPLVAERNDGFPLWWHRPARAIRPVQRRIFAAMLRDVRYESMLDTFADAMTVRGAVPGQPHTILAAVTIELVAAIIVMLENGVLPEVALQATQNVVRAMRAYEDRHGLTGPASELGVAEPGQLRYRNTLYLYGGNLLERMGRRDQARRWYLADIDTPELPRHLSFYLTAFKTAERLMSAYRVGDPPERARLTLPILRVWQRCLVQTRKYARQLLAVMDEQPGLDLAAPKVRVGGRSLLIAGEACREPLLAALLFGAFVNGVDYAHVDYGALSPVG